MKIQQEEELPLTEDLMREHGVLNRVLLIYEEIIRRIEGNELPEQSLSQAVVIIKDFIENYHEKLEEDYLFPLFEKSKRQVSLVKTLRKQHVKGRDITAELQGLIDMGGPKNKKREKQIVRLLKRFITMYRPHEAREDTVLFPQVRSLVSKKEFEQLGDKFEDLEYKLFGEEGFFGIVKRVAAIEKELGIYNLEQFTPTTYP